MAQAARLLDGLTTLGQTIYVVKIRFMFHISGCGCSYWRAESVRHLSHCIGKAGEEVT